MTSDGCPSCTAWLNALLAAPPNGSERQVRECPDCRTILHFIDERGRRQGRAVVRCAYCADRRLINVNVRLSDAVVIDGRSCPHCRPAYDDRALLLLSLTLLAVTPIKIPSPMRHAALEQIARINCESGPNQRTGGSQ